MSFSPLLDLQREIRDLIYTYCLTSHGGYEYHFPTNSLRQSTGEKPDIALAYTCWQIYQEMEGLALRLNTIKFSTSHSKKTSVKAALLHAVLHQEIFTRWELVRELAPSLLTLDMAQMASEKFPAFSPIIDSLSRHKNHYESIPWLCQVDLTWVEAPSLWQDFSRFVLRLLSQHPMFLNKIGHGRTGMFANHSELHITKIVHGSVDPWIILRDKELQQLLALHRVEKTMPHHYGGLEYSYSATSAFIPFQQNLLPKVRANIRNVHLNEDWHSVARPECHGRGLIPVFQKNSRLRIVRSVNIWQAVLPVKDNKVRAPDISMAVGAWIAECHMLPSLGLPSSSYTLVFDGQFNPEKGTAIFNVLQQDAVWQIAMDKRFSPATPSFASWQDRRRRTGYLFEVLPIMLQSITQQSPLIRCNFNAGVAHDDIAITRTQGWTLEEWEQSWSSHTPKEFEADLQTSLWYDPRWWREYLWY